MRDTTLRVSAYAMAVAMGVTLLSGPVLAQEDPPPPPPQQGAQSGGLETVYTQATRQSTDVQTTAVAVTAVTPQQIENRFVQDIRGIADLAPNVTIENVPGFNAASIGIRGTGTGDIITSIDSAVGVVVDEFSLVHTQGQLIDPFDVESVEILRGPQGTLFGKNSTGGVVIVRTQKPELDVYSGKVQLRGGNIGTLEGRAAVNIPLGSKVATRITAMYQHNHGQYTNDKVSQVYGVNGYGTPFGLPVNGDGRHLGGTDVFFGRAKILFAPTDNYEIVIKGELLRDRSDSVPSVNETPLDGQIDAFGIPRSFLFNPIGFPGIQQTCAELTQKCILSTGVSFRNRGLRMEQGHRVDSELLSIQQTLDMDVITAELFLGYRKQKERLPSTYTGEAYGSLFDATRNLEREQMQAELRLTSNFDGPFNFIAGGAYYINNLDWRSMSYVGFTAVPFVNPDCNVESPVGDPDCVALDPSFGANNRANFGPLYQDGDALGLYTEMYYQVTDKLKITFGARYSYEKKHFGKWNGAVLTADEVDLFERTRGDRTLADQITQGATSQNPGRFNFVIDDLMVDSAGNRVNRKSWDNFTFKGVIGYEFDDSNYVYASFNQGFKSGSFVETCTSIGTCEPFEEETADSFEVGWKGDLFDNRVRVNADVFYTKINNVVRSQVVRIINQFGLPDQETQFRNIAGQRNWGVEMELNWLVTDAFRVNFNASYLNAAYTEFVTDIDGGAGSTTMPECIDIDALGNDDAVCLGIKPNFAPKWKIGGDFSYDVPMGNSGSLRFNGAVNWTPAYEYTVFNSDYTQFQARTLIDLSVTYTSVDENWMLSLFAKNLLNETYRVSANSVAGLWNFTNYGQTRRWGAELTFSF
ncbi:MAG: TonB-dependent receptor [Sphingomonadales bacterium]